MKKRIGNDFLFYWIIKENGIIVNPESVHDFKIEIKHEFSGSKISPEFDIVNGSARVRCDAFEKLGVYQLIATWRVTDTTFTDGFRDCAADIESFEIVGRSAQADNENPEITTEMAIGFEGSDAYDVWVQNGNEGKTYEDYIAFLQKPATLAAAAADLAMEAANSAATLANDKAGFAQSAATLANTKAGLANDAAILATEKATLADSKATLANDKAVIAQAAADNADAKAAEVTDAVLSAGQLGPIKPTDAAPTPARNGNYVFSIGGNKPAWLTSEAGVTTVKAGDGVAVVYTAPNGYAYTHVDMSSEFALKNEIANEFNKNKWLDLLGKQSQSGKNIFDKDVEILTPTSNLSLADVVANGDKILKACYLNSIGTAVFAAPNVFDFVSPIYAVRVGEPINCSHFFSAGTTVKSIFFNKDFTIYETISQGSLDHLTSSIDGYVRISVRTGTSAYHPELVQIEKNTVKTTYESFYSTSKIKINDLSVSTEKLANNSVTGEKIALATIDSTNIKTKSIGTDSLSFIGTGKNKFKKDSPLIIDDKMFYNGYVGTFPGQAISHPVKILAGQTLFCNTAYLDASVQHKLTDVNDENPTFVGNTKAVTAIVDGLVRFSLRLTYPAGVSKDTTQIEVGTIGTAYESYYDTLEGVSLPYVVPPVSVLYCYPEAGIDTESNYYGITALTKACIYAETHQSVSNPIKIWVMGKFIFKNVSNITKCLAQLESTNAWYSPMWSIPNVSFYGLGINKSKVIVDLSDPSITFPTSPSGTYQYSRGNYTPMTLLESSYVEGIGFDGIDCRYTLHQEGNATGNKVELYYKDCKITYDSKGIYPNSLIGCGLVQNGTKITYKNCRLENNSAYNAFAGHGAGTESGNQHVITFEGCNINAKSLIGWNNYTNRTTFNFIGCLFNNKEMPLIIGQSGISDTPLFLNIQIDSPTMLMQLAATFKKNLYFTGAKKIRIGIDSTAYGIIYNSIEDSFEVTSNFCAYEYAGQYYKDDSTNTDGYLFAKGIAEGRLGTILGDCSSVNKTLKVLIDDVEHIITFNINLISENDTNIISIINSGLSNTSVVCSLKSPMDFWMANFKDSTINRNYGTGTIRKGMGVVYCESATYAFGVRAAKSTDGKIDGIAMDDMPCGSEGRIMTKGLIYANKVGRFGLLCDVIVGRNAKLKISAVDGIFTTTTGTDNILTAVPFYDPWVILK